MCQSIETICNGCVIMSYGIKSHNFSVLTKQRLKEKWKIDDSLVRIFFSQPRPACLIIFRVAVYSQISTSDENDEPMIMIIMAWVSFRSSNWNLHKVHQLYSKVLLWSKIICSFHLAYYKILYKQYQRPPVKVDIGIIYNTRARS